MSRKRKKRSKKWYGSILLSAILISLIGGIAVYAVLDNNDSESVQSVKVSDSEIESSTLVIGSHLIHINGLTDELYAIAMESASEFNQNGIYYKSELAGGAWFEISNATSIADITTSGTPVDKSVIEALEFTHKTGADGITTDLRTQTTVSVFNIPDPYNLQTMEELEPLRIQYQILQEKEEQTDSDKTYLSIIGALFEKELEDDTTKALDETLSSLESYKNNLSSRGKPTNWKEETEGVMASVDAERRILVLTKLGKALDILECQANGVPYEEEEEEGEEGDSEEDSEEGDSEEGSDSEEGEAEDTTGLEVNTEIVAAIGDCIQNVQDSINAYRAKCLSATGETTADQMEYQYSQELISKASDNDTEGCDGAMEKLCALRNILDGTIENQTTELDTLTSQLISMSYQKYMADLSAGESPEYQTARADGMPQSVLTQYLTQQKAGANADRLEYQSMLEAAFLRMDNGAAQIYVLQLIDGVPAMNQSVVGDAASAYLRETVQEHLEWLRSKYGDLVKNGADSTQMEKLEQKKEDLENQYRDALDKNDLALANRIRAEMDAVQKDMDSLMASLTDILNSPYSSETDKAKARAELGNSNTAALLSDMAGNLASEIRSGDGEEEDLKNQLAALSAAAQLNPDAGLAALDQVKDALDQSTGMTSDLAKEMQNDLAEAKENVAQYAGEGLSDATLSSLMEDVLNRVFGTDFAHATSAQQASAILAMEWYGQERNSDTALSQAGRLAVQAAESKNPYLYEKYTLEEAYMSLQALGQTLGYRYIFDDAHSTVTLQKGKSYYEFISASREYKREGGSKKELKTAPKLMGTLYIHGEDSQKIFSTKAEYISQAQYAVVGTTTVETQAKEIYERLMEGG